MRASGVDETAAVPRLYGSYFSNSGYMQYPYLGTQYV
eukprot:COSAG02_NODE_46324_length_350_cov_0.509960_1_plen_36_part_01